MYRNNFNVFPYELGKGIVAGALAPNHASIAV